VTELYSPLLASFPLLLWKTPPGLELILAQEGVAFETVKDAHPFSFRGGRFVLFDGRAVSASAVHGLLTSRHVAIDIDSLRRDEPVDPFEALIDHQGARSSWTVGPYTLSERVGRFPKAWIRRRLIHKLRQAVTGSGGLWVRLASFPYPYRSAFSFRADLDEPDPDDYDRFAAARMPLADCSTHFVSTYAYGHHASVLSDLRRHDTQSHGHFHHVYREPETNRVNLHRAHRILRSAGIEPVGFAGPHGRWDKNLDDVLEELGYRYASDFQLGYDDFPFYPWKRNRFSSVLQIPIHPVCEGLFLEAGSDDPFVIGAYLREVVLSKLDAEEFAIVYGHPERRLGRMPEVLAMLSRAIAKKPLVWRTTLTELARWWRWRSDRRWLVISHDDHRLDIQFDEWDTEYDLALEIQRGRFRCLLPVTSSRMSLRLTDLVYERSEESRSSTVAPTIDRGPLSLKQAVRTALDWETVTPLDEIPPSSLSNRVKRGLRRWKHHRAGTPS
jgi:peptidoglycan/xylan/chitin deacetylase (PgdA/CDA1 family)